MESCNVRVRAPDRACWLARVAFIPARERELFSDFEIFARHWGIEYFPRRSVRVNSSLHASVGRYDGKDSLTAYPIDFATQCLNLMHEPVNWFAHRAQIITTRRDFSRDTNLDSTVQKTHSSFDRTRTYCSWSQIIRKAHSCSRMQMNQSHFTPCLRGNGKRGGKQRHCSAFESISARVMHTSQTRDARSPGPEFSTVYIRTNAGTRRHSVYDPYLRSYI